jgi:hypothetical protein
MNYSVGNSWNTAIFDQVRNEGREVRQILPKRSFGGPGPCFR